MLISATGRKSNSASRQIACERGVTLVELLVVLAIIAMIASVVVISAPPPRSSVQNESEKLAARVDYAAGRAITAGETIGLEISESGYRFLKYDRGQWSEMTFPQFSAQQFPNDLAIEVKVEEIAKRNEPQERNREKNEKPEPEIRFTPTGETTPFSVTFKTQRQNVSVSLDEAGAVSVKAGDQDV